MTDKKADLSIKSIIFWRHVVGILIILLFQRGAENLPFFLGRWLATTTIALAGAGLICGIGYLFFTSLLKTRVVRIFVTCTWVLAALQLFGQWALPDLMTKIANTKSTVNLDDFSTIVPGHDGLTQEELKEADSLGIDIQEYGRRKAKSAKLCWTAPTILDLNCSIAVMEGRR